LGEVLFFNLFQRTSLLYVETPLLGRGWGRYLL
jgi:hypothetical protein